MELNHLKMYCGGWCFELASKKQDKQDRLSEVIKGASGYIIRLRGGQISLYCAWRLVRGLEAWMTHYKLWLGKRQRIWEEQGRYCKTNYLEAAFIANKKMVNCCAEATLRAVCWVYLLYPELYLIHNCSCIHPSGCPQGHEGKAVKIQYDFIAF